MDIVTLLEVWISRLAGLCAAVALALAISSVVRARSAPRGRASGSHAALLRWPIMLAITVATITVGIILWKPLPVVLGRSLRLAFLLVGALLYFPSLALYLWGFFSLGPMFGVSSAMSAQLYQHHRLVLNGPYRHVRHPMYLGVILVALGALLIFRTWMMLVFAPLMLGLVFRARREDSLLASQFGEQWADYARRTPAWIPRLRSRNSFDHR